MRVGCSIVQVMLINLCLGLACADTLEPVIVKGGANVDENAQVGEVEHAEFTGSYNRVDSGELQRETRSVARVIAQQSGVQMRQIGGEGSYSSISIRGASSAQTDVYLDGVLLNSAADGGVDLSQLELLNLGSIDIYRGSTPVQLGLGNIGGAVNLRSFDTPVTAGDSTTDLRATRLLFGIGSFDTQRFQISHQQNHRTWDSAMVFTHRQSDNDFDLLNSNGTPLNSADDAIEKRHNADFQRTSALIKFGQQQGEHRRMDGLLQLSQRAVGVPHYRNREDINASYDTESLQFQLNQRRGSWRGSDWSHQNGFYFNHTQAHYDDRLSQIGLGTQHTVTDSDVAGLRTYWERIGETGTFSIRSELRADILEQTDLIGTRNFTAERRSVQSSVNYSLFRLEDSLLITPSLRLQYITDDYQGAQRGGESARNNSIVLPQVGLKYVADEQWHWAINLGLHEREPLFFELFGDRGFYTGNEQLKSEKGANLDAGLQWNSASPHPRSVKVTLFASVRDDLIVSTYDARGVGRSENISEARIVGLESDLDWQWTDKWSSKLNLTWQSAQNRNPFSTFEDTQLPGEAQFVAFASLRYQRDRWRAWLDLHNRQKRFYDTANLLPAADVLLANLGLSYSLNRTSVDLHLRNLGDATVEDFNGFPQPGRSVELTVNHKFN